MDTSDLRSVPPQLKAGSRHPVAQFHPYHTKVPPSVIAARIAMHTAPGETVLDPFAGSGMTGVAALDSGRHAVLADLSPAAAFISSVNTRRHDAEAAALAMTAILDESQREWGGLYRSANGSAISYFVWSDVFTCPECHGAFPLFPFGVEHLGTKVRTLKEFPCPSCRTPHLNIRRIKRIIDEHGVKTKQVVWTSGGSGTARFNRPPTAGEVQAADAVERMPIPSWVPDVEIDGTRYSAKLAQLGPKGIRSVNDLLSRRNLLIFSDLWRRVGDIEDLSLRTLCRALLTGSFTTISERQGYFGGGGGMSGNLYMPVIRMEKNPYLVIRRRLGLMAKAEQHKEAWTTTAVTTVQNAATLAIAPASVDYVYTDPPFGSNMIYSELNLVHEAWLGHTTKHEHEAVIDPTRELGVGEYESRMCEAFREVRRVLRPGRTMTVQFHNSDDATWQALQRALDGAGFAIAHISILDKGGTTLLSDIRQSSVSQDLLIDARRVDGALPKSPSESTTSRLEDVRAVAIRVLAQAPADLSAERLRQYTYSAIVAHYLQAGHGLPASSSVIYEILRELGLSGSAEKELRRTRKNKVSA